MPREARPEVPTAWLWALGAVLALTSWCAGAPMRWPFMVAAVGGASALLWFVFTRYTVRLRTVLLLAVVFRLLFVWLPPVLSDDAFRYVWDGMVQLKGFNPFLHLPSEEVFADLHQEPVYRHMNSTGYYSVYPPISQLVFAAGGAFYHAGWSASYGVIKASFLLLELLGLVAASRVFTARVVMLYAWHPLALLEVAGQAHTEAAVVGLLGATLWAARRGQGGWAGVFLAAAGWVKLYPFVLLPLLWRRFRWRAVWPAALVTVLLVLPYAHPEVPANVQRSLELYVRYFEFNAGPYLGLKGLLAAVTGDDWSKVLGPAFRAVFLLSLPLWYLLDARRDWSLRHAMLVVLGAFVLCATTVHPWYLLPVLFLAVGGTQLRTAWVWLATVSLGTYLLYSHQSYLPWVVAGWGGWAVLAAAAWAPGWLQRVQKRGAQHKAAWLLPALRLLGLPDEAAGGRASRVLDLGAGEGYVGEAVAARTGAEVQLADVLPMNRTALPHVRYDGRSLPFADGAFDVTLLYFVLHHCEDPERVLAEALRVSRRGVVVVESTYEGALQHRVLRGLDRLANRLRSGGAMAAQEPHLAFRTIAAWRAAFERLGAACVDEARRGRWIHRQVRFTLRAQHDMPVIAIQNKWDGSDATT